MIVAALIEAFAVMGLPARLEAACEIVRLCRPESRR